jgi:hypothetical protein
VLPQGALARAFFLPREDRASNLVGPVRDTIGLLGGAGCRPVGEAHRTKMSDVHAEHALQGLTDHTDLWGALGAHVVLPQRARAARAAEGVLV